MITTDWLPLNLFLKCKLEIVRVFHCLKNVQIRTFFWSVFSRIRTVYREIRSICPYSVRMRENTDQKKLRIWTLFTECSFWTFIHVSRYSHNHWWYSWLILEVALFFGWCTNFRSIHPEVFLLCGFIEITLLHGCSPVDLLHIFRTPFPRITSEWLLLKLKL